MTDRLVLCFGNELHGDDGFGPAVGRRLAGDGFPGGWALHQIGTRGLDALDLLLGCEAALLIDAAAPQGHPGRVSMGGTCTVPVESTPVGHGMGVGHLLATLRALNHTPRLQLLTAEMAEVRSFHIGLSLAVKAAVPKAAALAVDWMNEVTHAAA